MSDIAFVNVTSPTSNTSITVTFYINNFSPSTIDISLIDKTTPAANQSIVGLNVSKLTVVGTTPTGVIYSEILGQNGFLNTDEYDITFTSGEVTRTVSFYRIAYDKNDGSVGSITRLPSRLDGSNFNIEFSNLPVRSGYTFMGWNTTSDGAPPGINYPYPIPEDGTTFFTVSSNVTLYAQWEADMTPPAPPGGAVCFLGFAPVLTPTGWARIDSLAAGDLVRTADGRDVAIQRVKHQRILTPSVTVNPYVIPAGLWGATENLAISPRHCVAVPGRGMVEARFLGLKQLSMRAAFDYYNLELPEWDNMVVAGVEVESLAPRKRVVMTVAELAKLAAGVPIEKLSKVVTLLADGKVAVQMARTERRMKA